MGLFGRDPLVDGDILAALIAKDRASLKTAENAQPTLRGLAGPGEKIEFLATGVSESAIAVIGTRVCLLAPGLRVLHDVPLAQVGCVSQTPSHMNTTFLEDTLDLKVVPESEWPWSTFASAPIAREVCVRINRMILTARPRSIPKLNPDYFEEIVANSGKPKTSAWLNVTAYWIAFLLGGQIAATLGTTRLPELFDEFMHRFIPVVEGEDFLSLPDDIINWAWSKHPVLHRPLGAKVDKWRGNAKGGWLKRNEPDHSVSEDMRIVAQPGQNWLFTFRHQKLYAYAPI